MKKLLEYIHQIKEGAYKNTKFVSVIYHTKEDGLECKMVYEGSMNQQDKQEITQAIKRYLQRDIPVVLKLKKSILDVDVIKMLVRQYLKEHYASLYENFDESKIEASIDDQVTVTIGFLPVFNQFIENTDFKKSLKEYLENQFFKSFIIETYQYQGDNSLQLSLQKLEKKMEDDILAMDIFHEKRTIEVLDVEKLVGETIDQQPIAIADQSVGDTDTVICGVVQYYQKKMYTPKKATSTEEKAFFSFQLKDETGSMRCVIFPTKTTFAQLETIEDGMQVVVMGKIDEFNGATSMRVKQISTCHIVPSKKANETESFIEKPCPEKYMHVSPEPYIVTKQSNLFDLDVKNVCPYLQGKTFVVFDLETTGLDYQTNAITEIGAIKIVDGKIVETFSTLVNPKQEISEEITKLTKITNAMVKDKHTIEDIIGDFYKFCDHSILVGHNIDFDFKFVYKAGRENGYLFNHKQVDTLFLARQQLRSLKNHKLGTVADYLGVKLENAHRAVNDALATAEVFLILAENIQ